jgi:hypothetical protein
MIHLAIRYVRVHSSKRRSKEDLRGHNVVLLLCYIHIYVCMRACNQRIKTLVHETKKRKNVSKHIRRNMRIPYLHVCMHEYTHIYTRIFVCVNE